LANLIDLIDRLTEAQARLLMRVAELERKADTTFRHGKVTDVDTKKQLARIEIGERDGKPLKSAWVPYAQLAGEFKAHRPPTVGQQMTMMAPNGEIRQAVLLPFTWSNQNPSPSEKPDEHVTTYGKLKIVEKKDSFTVSLDDKVSLVLTSSTATLKVGSSEVEVKDGHVNIVSDKVHTVGATHLGVDAKDAVAADKVLVGPEMPAAKTYAKA